MKVGHCAWKPFFFIVFHLANSVPYARVFNCKHAQQSDTGSSCGFYPAEIRTPFAPVSLPKRWKKFGRFSTPAEFHWERNNLDWSYRKMKYSKEFQTSPGRVFPKGVHQTIGILWHRTQRSCKTFRDNKLLRIVCASAVEFGRNPKRGSRHANVYKQTPYLRVYNRQLSCPRFRGIAPHSVRLTRQHRKFSDLYLLLPRPTSRFLSSNFSTIRNSF